MGVKGWVSSPTSAWETEKQRCPPVTWRHLGAEPDPADVLRQLIDLQGFSIRRLAKAVVGEQASDNQWENQRRELTEWVKGRRRGGNDPSDESLDQLSTALRVPSYLLMLLYRHHEERERIREQAEEILRVLPPPESEGS